jgi:hypothetical protein
MTNTAGRMERAYLLALLRTANVILRELTENVTVLPAGPAPKMSAWIRK